MSYQPTGFYKMAIESLKAEPPRLFVTTRVNAFIEKVECLLEQHKDWEINNDSLANGFENIRPSYMSNALWISLDSDFWNEEREILWGALFETLRDVEAITWSLKERREKIEQKKTINKKVLKRKSPKKRHLKKITFTK